MPEAKTIEERVIEIVFEQFKSSNLRKSEINHKTRLVADLGADSLDAVELAMELEEEFDVDIPDDASDKFKTVGDIIDYFQAQPAVAD